ncbi:MAG: hypothetical protein KAR12_09345 [Methylococcales bacterium]|nr:hypothetical protein [Methylococcales bacterium]
MSEQPSQNEEVSVKSAVNNPVLYEPVVSLALNSAINSKTEKEVKESSKQLIKDGITSLEEFTENIISSDELLEIEHNTLQHDTDILVASNKVESVPVSPVLEEKLLTVENKEEVVVVNSLLNSDESNLETGDQTDAFPVNPVLEEKTLTVESQQEVIVNSLLNIDETNLESSGQVDGLPVIPVMEEQALPEESAVNKLLNNDESNEEQAEPVINYCYHVGPFANNAVLNTWRKSNKIDAGFVSRFTKENNVVSSYLVYFPAAETYAQSTKNVQRLKQKGITDYWLFRRGELKGAISLGLFVKKSSALSLQEKLVKAGFTIEIKERYKKEQSLFAEILTKDKALKDDVVISDKQSISECEKNTD